MRDEGDGDPRIDREIVSVVLFELLSEPVEEKVTVHEADSVPELLPLLLCECDDVTSELGVELRPVLVAGRVTDSEVLSVGEEVSVGECGGGIELDSDNVSVMFFVDENVGTGLMEATTVKLVESVILRMLVEL